MSFDALEETWYEDDNPDTREHVTPYIYENPDRFNIGSVANDINYSHMRWTVDTLEDYTFACKIYEHFKDDTFNWKEILKLLEKHPEYLKINEDIKQKELQTR